MLKRWLNKAFRKKIIDIQSSRRPRERGGWYKLGCSLGILEVNYRATDLESTISLSEAT